MVYIKKALGEFKRIRWLSFRKAIIVSVIVIAAALVAGFLLGALDSLFVKIIEGVIF